MSYDLIGVELGRALMNWGLAQQERKQREEDRRLDRQERMADNELMRKQRREDAAYEAGLRPPEIKEVEEVGADGKRLKVARQWNVDREKGTGSWQELSRTPLMVEPTGRPFEVVRGGNRVTMQRYNDGTEKELGSGPRWNPSAGAGDAKPPAPSWQIVEDPDQPGVFVKIDANSGKFLEVNGKRVRAPIPSTEKPPKEDDESDLLVPRPREKPKSGPDQAMGAGLDAVNKRRFPNAPPIGTVEDGLRYRGGDPSSESSWAAA